MYYEFTDDYLTGIDFIDNEHRRLFAIANEAHDVLTNEFMADKYNHIVQIMEELRDYTKTHFAHEEQYMDGIGYQHRFSQLHQHTEFIKKLEAMDLEKIDAQQQASLLEVLDFLAQWLQHHIKGMDRRIGH